MQNLHSHQQEYGLLSIFAFLQFQPFFVNVFKTYYFIDILSNIIYIIFINITQMHKSINIKR